MPRTTRWSSKPGVPPVLIWEGKNVIEVAAQAGHTPETCLRHYARLFRDAPAMKVPAEDAIRAARNTDQQRFAV